MAQAAFSFQQQQEAGPLTQADLHAIADDHAVWLASEGREGKRANLRDADLRGLNLVRFALQEASLRGANLEGVDVTGADLRGADLAESYLVGANFSHAQLGSANLARAVLSQAKFYSADLTGADLSVVEARGVEFNQANAAQAVLREANFEGATLTACQFAQASMRGINLSHAVMTNCDFTQAELRDAQCYAARFEQCIMQEAALRGAVLDDVDLSGSDFANALEVEPRYYMDYIARERLTLMQDKAAMAEERYRVNAALAESQSLKQKTDVQTRAIMEFNEQAEEAMDRLASARKWFVAVSALWSVIALGFVGFLFLMLDGVSLDSLRWGELGLMVVAILVPFILFAQSVGKANSARSALADLQKNFPSL